MADDKIALTFIHPTNPSESLIAEVSPRVTPEYLIDQLVKADFIPATGRADQYKLRNSQTGFQLHDGQSLKDAGIVADTVIGIDHNTSGARA
jgi:hypothetical protein